MMMGLKPEFIINQFKNHIRQSKTQPEPHRSIALREVSDTLGQMILIAIDEGIIKVPGK